MCFNFYSIAECAADSGCSGTTDTCDTNAGVCKCGSNDACSGATPKCNSGTCEGTYNWLDTWFNQEKFSYI